MKVNPRLKYYIRLDGTGNKIAGSGVWRQKQPRYGKWVVEDLNVCCFTSTSTTTV